MYFPDDFNLEGAVDATQTVAQARPLLAVGETLEDSGHGGSEGRLSALQSARGAATAVRSSAQDDRVAMVAQGGSKCSQDAQRSTVRRALGWSRLPPDWADAPLWSPLDARCVHASAILADPRARLAACV